MKLLQKKQQGQIRKRASLRGDRGEGRAPTPYTDRYAYRRNRTLTGSLASDVASANEHRSELKSSRVQFHHLRRHRRRLFAALAIVAAIVGVLMWLIWQSIVTVNIKAVAGASQPLRSQQYTSAIQGYFTSHFFERNRVTVDTAALTAHMQQEFPEIKQIALNPAHTGVGEATFDVTMRQPVVSWQTGATRLFVDKTGVSFEHNYYANPTVQVVDETGIQAVNNHILASNRFLSFIGLVIGHLESQGYTASKVVLPVETTHQLLVSIESVPFPVKVSTDRSAADQAEDAARALNYLGTKGIKVTEYLDVRVSGRAYYK